MKKLALSFLAASVLLFAGSAHAAAVSKSLKKAVTQSFNGLKAKQGAARFASDRLKISSNGKTASVSIQALRQGPRPSPPPLAEDLVQYRGRVVHEGRRRSVERW